MAQRTSENAITSASDAFGTSIGNEQVGLYRENSVRGFSPITAGNRRLEGLYFDLQGNGLTPRLTARSVVRVGLPALNFPFPAPSGIVDYSLRPSGDDFTASVAVGRSGFGGYFAEIDASGPIIPERLTVAAGGHYQRRNFEDGRHGDYRALSLIPTLRLPRTTITAFLSAARSDVDAVPILTTAGPMLPPEIAGGRFLGQDWARSVQSSRTYGLLASHALNGALTFRLGAFESRSTRSSTFTDLFLNVGPDGSATNVIVADPRLPARWTSGEARLSWNRDGRVFDQTVHFSLRGRDKRLEIGGSATATLGPAPIGGFVERPEPIFAFGAPTVNSVRQWIAGVAYVARWDGVLEVNAGLQRSDYRSSLRQDERTATTRDSSWLYNATLAVTPTDWLAIYAGYTRGLEETAAPPPSAVNRDDAVQASRTEQREAGVRLAFGSTRIVAGVFQIERPYFSVDPRNRYGELGILRNRGLEVSVTAQPIEGLSLIAGLVLLHPAVIGEAVESGRIGPRAVGTPTRTARLDLNYRTPLAGLSLDLSLQHNGPAAASTRNFAELGGLQLIAPAATTLDLGARYRFNLGETPFALRLLAANLFDQRGYDVRSSQSFTVRNGRRFSIQLSADF